MSWVKLLESLVLGLVRGVLGLKKTDEARELGETLGSHIGDDILKRGVHPSARPPPLPDRQLPDPRALPSRPPQALTPVRPRPSAAPPPIMPAPIRPQRKH